MTAEQKATAKKALGITVQIAALLVITVCEVVLDAGHVGHWSGIRPCGRRFAHA